jgi:ATP phosphoribosyltransferase regulatory subunit
MSIVDRWLLPDGIEDILPEEAGNLEAIRRRLLDLYSSWGYQYVIPPMIEFLESLLTGTGRDLDLETFKVTDLVSGRTMGIRADMTPQVARIDAHSLNQAGPVRLCYAGTVLQSRAENMLASRTPIKVGAELFGESDRESDLEIVSLMIESVRVLGVEDIHIELGDVSIFRQLLATTRLDDQVQGELFALVQRKAFAELGRTIDELDLDEDTGAIIKEIPSLCGYDVLSKASETFKAHPPVLDRLDNLRWVTEGIKSRFPEVDIYYDLSELRGFNYHTGIVFAAYVGGSGQTIAKGGRYDHIGEVFGRRRGATGFDVNLKSLADQTVGFVDRRKVVLTYASEVASEEDRWQKVQSLRSEGYIVVESGEKSGNHDFELVYEAGEWRLQEKV